MQEERILNILKNLISLLSTLENISAQKLLECVPSSEHNDIYIKFRFGKDSDVIVSLFNANTKCIVKKIYTLPEMLKKCTDIFTVMEFMNEDTVKLYTKSKERIFKENTVLSM